MEDKSLPVRELQETPDERANLDRRKVIKRTALVGLPLVLATVRGRNAWGSTLAGSATTSANPSTP